MAAIGLFVLLLAGGVAVARAPDRGPSARAAALSAARAAATSAARSSTIPAAFPTSGVTVSDLNNGSTAASLAQMLAGSGVTISAVTYTGDPRAAGAFTNGADSIGFGSGVVLSSGKVQTYSTDTACTGGVEGPNTCHEAAGTNPAGSEGPANSTAFATPGDPDLDALIAGTGTTNDAAVLQFDFVPKQSTITINYVFSSEEYSDFVGDFNDVFGFFVNGSDCALVPGTTAPVAVNTINNGNDGDPSVAASNPQFFRDNVRPLPSIDSQMDGLTTVLTCTASVKAGQSNHMKLAIADTGDQSLDSAVFIQAASLTSGVALTGGRSFAGNAPLALSGPLATFTDATTPGAQAGSYQASVNWGDGSPGTAGTITGSGGQFTVSGSHTYAQPGTYTITVTVAQVGNAANTATATDQAVVGAGAVRAPTLSESPPAVKSSEHATFTGTVNPHGLPTSAHFEYGLDSSLRTNVAGLYSPGIVYDHSTPSQPVGSDFATHTVSATVSDLVPNALYHVRLVATNPQGTTAGPDQTFQTKKDRRPRKPVLGKSANLVPVSGVVFIKPPKGKSLRAVGPRASAIKKGQGFVPLTEARQVPLGSQIDARRGSLKIVTATGQHGKTQAGTFGGGLFKLSQKRSGRLTKGLTTLSLLEGTFKGAPSFATCKGGAAADGTASAHGAALSRRILQTLHSRDSHGRYRTRGHYSAGTVRGTQWDTVDRCDGTLTKVKRGTVDVFDFHRRKTITVHAGHSYLARAFKRRHH